MVSVDDKKVKNIKKIATRRLNRHIFGHCISIKSNWQKPLKEIYNNTNHHFKKQLKMPTVKYRDGSLIHQKIFNSKMNRQILRELQLLRTDVNQLNNQLQQLILVVNHNSFQLQQLIGVVNNNAIQLQQLVGIVNNNAMVTVGELQQIRGDINGLAERVNILEENQAAQPAVPPAVIDNQQNVEAEDQQDEDVEAEDQDEAEEDVVEAEDQQDEDVGMNQQEEVVLFNGIFNGVNNLSEMKQINIF